MACSSCREVPKLGTLRFPEHVDAGPAPGSSSGTPRFVLTPAGAALFESDYRIRTSGGVLRHEQVSLLSDGAGLIRRVQRLRFEAPGEPAVHRHSEERLQDGVHLTRGPRGHFWRHDDREAFEGMLRRDLDAWHSLGAQLGLRGADPDVARSAGARAQQGPRRRPLVGKAGAAGVLELDGEGRLQAVSVDATGGAAVRYQARLGPPGDVELRRVPPDQIHAPERPRPVHELRAWLKRVREGP